MRYIDAFNHFFPPRFYKLMLESPAGQKDLGKRVRAAFRRSTTSKSGCAWSIRFPITRR